MTLHRLHPSYRIFGGQIARRRRSAYASYASYTLERGCMCIEMNRRKTARKCARSNSHTSLLSGVRCVSNRAVERFWCKIGRKIGCKSYTPEADQ